MRHQNPVPRLRSEGREATRCPACERPAFREPGLTLVRPDGSSEDRPGPVRCVWCESHRCRVCRQPFTPKHAAICCSEACRAALRARRRAIREATPISTEASH